MVFCNVVVPMSLWFKRTRHSLKALFVISVFVNIGMWYERFVIIVTSLAHEFDPSAWQVYTPSLTELTIMVGSFRLVLLLVPALREDASRDQHRGGQGAPGTRARARGPLSMSGILAQFDTVGATKEGDRAPEGGRALRHGRVLALPGA